ncbi:MAG: hypothetical protein AAB395_02060 [Patescibacteria group bacterium]
MTNIQALRENLASFRDKHEEAEKRADSFLTDTDTKLSSVLTSWLFVWATRRCDEIIANINMKLVISPDAIVEEQIMYPDDVVFALGHTELDMMKHLIELLEKAWEDGSVTFKDNDIPRSEGACFVFRMHE